MIRPAQQKDIADVIRIIIAGYNDSGLDDRFQCAANPKSIFRVVTACMESENADLSVVELHGQVAGACLVEVVPFTWDDQTLLAIEHVWHMLPTWPNAREKGEWFMRMFDHMWTWASGKGAKSFTVNVKPGSPAAKFLKRKGLSHFENALTGGM